MAIASDIVGQAYREGNLVNLDATTGLPVLTAGQAAEGLSLLNKYLDSLFGFELGEFYFDWTIPPSTTSPVPARYPILPRDEGLQSNVWPYPPGNSRLLLKLVEDTTLYLPQTPDDGARIAIVNIGDANTYNLTLDGNGRLVKGADTVTDTPGNLTGQQLFYRADLGDWTLLSELASTDSSPLPALYDDLLAVGTLIRIAGRVGRSLPPESGATLARLMKRLKTQYRQKVPAPSAKDSPFYLPSSDIDRRGFGLGSSMT